MKTKLPLAEAKTYADAVIEILEPYCQRIEIAGSIRREKETVGDIEIVAIPWPVMDMFGEPGSDHQLDTLDYEALGIGTPIKGGHKYKQIALKQGINLDLFIITPPAEWGIQFIIRTGPAEFSKRVVTPRNKGGLLPSYLRVKDGAIWSHNHIVPTPSELDVFDLMGIRYIEPKDRL